MLTKHAELIEGETGHQTGMASRSEVDLIQSTVWIPRNSRFALNRGHRKISSGARCVNEGSSRRQQGGEMNDATVMLAAIGSGDSKAAEQLLVLVYDELRRLAASKLAAETAGQTLQPTALVHEAWLRLVGDQSRSFKDREHFFRASAE